MDQRFLIERDGRTEETFWTYAFSPVRHEDGVAVGVHSVVTVTTGRVRAEAALRAGAARSRPLTELAPALLWETDAGAAAVLLNARWTEYAGQALVEMQRRGWLAAVHPDDCARSARVFAEAYAAGQPLTVEHRNHHGRVPPEWGKTQQSWHKPPFRGRCLGDAVAVTSG